MSPRREDSGFLPNQLARRSLERAGGSAASRSTPTTGTGPVPGASGNGSGASGGDELTRRGFVKIGAAASGGLLMAVYFTGCAPDAGEESTSDVPSAHGTPEPGEGFRPSAWVEIHPDNTATITTSKSEMGQGVRTTLALIVAEELDLDWDTVRVRTAPADQETYGNQGTGGSASIRSSWEGLRRAGARARATLVAAAAEELGVPAGELEVANSTVTHAASDRALTYGELAGAASELTAPEDVQLKPPAEWTLLGQEHTGVDVGHIVTGRAEYGIDVRMDDMLFAAVARCPTHGGSVADVDDAAALDVPGVVRTVEVPAQGGDVNVHAGVAVVAENTWAALQGRDALEVTWDRGPGADHTSQGYSERMREAVSGPGSVTVNSVGDPDGVLEAAGQDDVVSATYEVPFLSHATMEPQNFTARVDGDRAHLRGPTQFPNWARGSVAGALGIAPEDVTVEVTLLGGGYGRRINPDAPTEAALVAREVDGPVQVVWDRTDDLRHDFYRPCAVHHIDAVLGDDGEPEAWRQRFCTPAISGTVSPEVDEEAFGVGESDGAANMSYGIPNRSCEYTYMPSELTRGWWRAVHTTHGTFAVESFIDELAERAGVDPVEFRLALIDELEVERPSFPDAFPFTPERLRGVLRMAAERGDWGADVPEGHGVGIACGVDHLTYGAALVEVSATGDDVRIERAVVAADCGPVLNPDMGRAQLEGGLVQGLSAALGERLTVENGAIVQGNFDDYQVLRMRDAPATIETHFVETDAHPTGLGEPAVPPAAPALANAVYAATGERIRTLPILGA